MKTSILKYAALNSVLTAAYVALVGLFMSSMEHVFIRATFLIPVAMLLLFVFSASLCAALFLGRPVMWYLDGRRKEAVTLFGYTLIFFFVILIVVFVVLNLINLS